MRPNSYLQNTLQLCALSLPLSSMSAAQVSFTATPGVNTGQRASGLVVADLDGDGTADMAVTTDGLGNQDLVEIYRGTGNGGFSPAGVIVLPHSSSPQGLAVADVDGDGDLDLAVVLRDLGQLMLLQNVGGLQFTPAGSASTSSVEPRIVRVADMDGDGDPDFVVASRDSNNVSVVLNLGGTLSGGQPFSAGQEPRDLAIADFDGDGLMDVAVSAHDSRSVHVLRGVGGGSLIASQTLSVPGGTRPEGIEAADIDSDGDADLIVGTGDDNNLAQNFVSIYTNNSGTFSGPAAYATGGFDAGDVAIGDFDVDGDVDVAVANESSASIAILTNSGAGAFSLTTSLSVAGQPDTLVAADIDGNGSTDLAATRRQAGGISIFLNDASGNLGIGTNYCNAAVNSSGQAAEMTASGSDIVAQNGLVIGSVRMPANVFGMYLVSQTPGFVPNAGGSQGNLCLGGLIGRFNSTVFDSGAAGVGVLVLDLTQLPTPTSVVSASAGQTWRFQVWFRDSAAGQATTNYSNGIAVTLR